MNNKNRKLILDFYRYCMMQGLSRPRLLKYLGALEYFSKTLDKDFDKADRKDIENLVAVIQERNTTSWTKHGQKIMIKRFYKWLKGNDEEYPPEVKWLKSSRKKCDEKLPSEGELLNEDEIRKLIETAKHPRDKALVSMLYESGCRIGELATLQIGNASIDEYGAVISVMGKTGSRNIRIIFSVPYLIEWLKMHPHSENKNSPLWVGIGTKNKDQCLKYGAIRASLQDLFKKAGIKKRCNPHFFRHSRATFLANHLTEFQMNQYLGWVQGSGMPSIYVHLSGKETENAILSLNGMNVKKEKKESILKPKSCSRCGTINAADNRYCCKCSGVLDVKTACEMEEVSNTQRKIRKSSDDVMNALMQDSEFKEIFARKIIEMKMNKEKAMLQIHQN
jgi:site-specific recombinase XerD/ribosomal protein S27AE